MPSYIPKIGDIVNVKINDKNYTGECDGIKEEYDEEKKETYTVWLIKMDRNKKYIKLRNSFLKKVKKLTNEELKVRDEELKVRALLAFGGVSWNKNTFITNCETARGQIPKEFTTRRRRNYSIRTSSIFEDPLKWESEQNEGNYSYSEFTPKKQVFNLEFRTFEKKPNVEYLQHVWIPIYKAHMCCVSLTNSYPETLLTNLKESFNIDLKRAPETLPLSQLSHYNCMFGRTIELIILGYNNTTKKLNNVTKDGFNISGIQESYNKLIEYLKEKKTNPAVFVPTEAAGYVSGPRLRF